MKKRSLLAAALAGLALPAVAHAADPAASDARIPTRVIAPAPLPAVLGQDERTAYRAVFDDIRSGQWADAQLRLDAMKPGVLTWIARAELYTAAGSPRVERDPLVALLQAAPELPQAPQLARLAETRGATELPPLPEVHELRWIAGAPIRRRAREITSDTVSDQLDAAIRPFVKDDDGAGAQALLETTVGLSPEALTEWQQRIAWIYYLGGDDNNARAMAAKAAAGSSDWAVQGDWVAGLAAWRQHDCVDAGKAFDAVATRAGDSDLRAAGLFWSSRAAMACGHPEKIQPTLERAAQYQETFYGLLARQALAIQGGIFHANADLAAEWQELEHRPNIPVAAALVEIGENRLAGEVIRRQAAIGDARDYPALVRLAGRLNLPETQFWLAHNGPAGAAPVVAGRFPDPNWTPDGGWRVDKALVYAHTLQESKFERDVVSSAGAYGLMQIRPGAATDIARARGQGDRTYDRAALTNPSTNIEIGQSYLEQLRDQPATGGLLPKVIAAYNAGPVPVQLWNATTRANGDPLLYIESIPYWETRGYVTTVLRNYWVYESENGKTASPSRAALAQGMWPRFPGMPGATAIRMGATASKYATASAD